MTTQRVVVLGTGTEVGKTWVSTAVLGLCRSGCDLLGLKPIESGFTDPERSDAAALSRAAGHDAAIPAFSYAAALAPMIAADANDAPSLAAVLAWVQHQESMHRHYHALHVTLIETAGGVFSPLSVRATNLDLANRFPDALWILVTANRLGVLHDVAATLHAMRALARLPDVLVLNAVAELDASGATNAEALRRLHPDVPLLEVAHDDESALSPLAARILHR